MNKLLARVPHWKMFGGQASPRCHRRTKWSVNVVEVLEDRSLLSAFAVQQSEIQQVSTASTSLVAFGSTWNYLDNGTDQGTAWRAAAFNDSAWAAGPSKLGYGDANNATTVGFGPSSTSKYITTYFRQSFNIANPASLSTLNLGVVRDDGVAVYLNGVEIVRNNLAAGALFNTLAPSPAIDAANETTPQNSSVSVASLPAGTLVAGTNVLAAEIHQQAITSSDIGFNFEMTGVGTTLDVVVDFNQAFDAATLAASDLLIDGAATASSVTIVDADTATFRLGALSAGSHTVSLAAGSVLATDATPLDVFSRTFTVATAPQYSFNHNPRLQLGNAPLVGYAGSSTDQMEVLWQTVSAGSGTQDSFTVEYRLAGSGGAWLATPATSTIATGVGGRINHFTTMTGLNYSTQYEYRVRHQQGDVLVNQFSDTFRTRNPASDASTFTFATYGDSASLSAVANFRSVQNQINLLDPRFVVLLGDNVYDSGTHTESDSRFSPTLNPEAADWMAIHVDYIGYGNHDIATGGGQPSEENFSVPVQVAGVNAPAAPPVTEEPEHNYSFDYGNVHFVTFDTNSLSNATRLDALLDYVEADLAASTATWKIVFGHHPVGGSPDKTESPADNYYQQVVPRLRAAGVSLFMVGHTHTYHWSYPLLGQSGGTATFVNDGDKNYEDLAGLVQLASGLGGRDIRTGTFTQFPFIAAGYSASTATVAEYGFTQIDVTPTQLVVKYIAADNGAVIDQFFITSPSGNTAPTIGDIANQTTDEDVATGSLAFTIGDVETAAGSLTVTATSSNTTLVPNANLVLGGSGANRTLTVTPAANQSGTATITVTVTDGNSATATDTFILTVNAINDLPSISDIADQSTNEDTATAALAFTIGDIETAAGSLTVTATSSNTALVPNANLVLGGSGANRTLTATPAANQSGTATITVTVTDGNSATATDTFTLTVNAINDLPTISDIANQTTSSNIATGALAFTVADVETAAASLTVTSTSSNTTLVPNANLVLGGSGANRTLTVTPAANQSGTATITVTVTDGNSATATDTFVLTVLASTKFFVVDNGVDDTFQYTSSGTLTLNHNLAATNSNPQGVVTSLDGSTVWVLDGNKTVFVYNASGTLLGSWTTTSPKTPTGITTNGIDLWIVDKGNDRVYFYSGAAARRSGSVAATSNFALGSGNTTPEGITTDGTKLWVVNSTATDKVFVYTIAGVLQGSWTIGNTTPTGLTIDPSGASQSIWIVDSGTDRVYEYTNARTRISGSQAAANSFALAAGNTSPQDIADPLSFLTSTSAASSSAPFIPVPTRLGETRRDLIANAVIASSELLDLRPAERGSTTNIISILAALETHDSETTARETTHTTASLARLLLLDDLFAEENWLNLLQNV